MLLRWICALVAVAILAGCGGGDEESTENPADDLGAMTCAEMQAEADHLAETLEGELEDLSEYRYVAAQADVPVETIVPPGESQGWMTWFIYYCTDDESQTAAEAFARAEEIVTDAGGPALAQERYERVADFEEPPPP